MYGLSAWRVTTLRVTGKFTLPLSELRNITLAQQQGRWLLFFRQTNLWAFDSKAFARRLRERWIFSTLEVHRTLPNTLTLKLIEEQPAFVYQLNDQIIGIDRNGVASTILPVLPPGIPQLQYLTPPELQLGDNALSKTQVTFLEIFISKIQNRNDAKLRIKKVTIAVAPETTLRLAMEGDWEVIVNATGSADMQVQALLLAYDQKLKGHKLEYVDVSVPARVYVK